MTSRVPPDVRLDVFLGLKRLGMAHQGMWVSATNEFYILHSEHCRAFTYNLVNCPFSMALDKGVATPFEPDIPYVLVVTPDGLLAPDSMRKPWVHAY